MTDERRSQRGPGRAGDHNPGRGSERRPIDRFAEPLDGLAAQLFEDRGAGLLVVDPAGLIVRANTTLRGMTTEPSDSDAGRPAAGLFATAQQEKLRHLILAGSRGDTLATPERLHLRGQDGAAGRLVTLSMTPLSMTPLSMTPIAMTPLSMTPSQGKDSAVDGLLLRITDIAGEARLETEIVEGRKMQAIGQMAGGIAHDFNNLLSTILAAADSILTRPGVDADTADDTRHVRLAAERGAALVQRLLAFSRRQPMRPRPVAVNTAITDLSGLLRRLLGARIELHLVLEQPGRTVWVDPTQLDQVLVNLAANAREAMPDGGRLTIRTGHRAVYQPETVGGETLPAGRYVLISVEDNGAGIPPDILPRIFEPFFTTRPHNGGTGLGLSTVLGIVRQSGGFLQVDTEPGRGTMFRIVLPRSDEPAIVESSTSEPASTARSGGQVSTNAGNDVGSPGAPAAVRGTVLLVDDEEPLRRLVERALRRTGWNVISAGSAEDALAALDAAPTGVAPSGVATMDVATMDVAPSDVPVVAVPAVDRITVVVSDIVMPGMDGPALIASLREYWPDLPAILVSGYAESMARGDAGIDQISFLAKPYEMKELLALVSASVTGRA